MATNFPTTLDSYATLVDNTDDVMAAHLNNPRDAIEALEAKVGIDGSAVTSSHDYKITNRMSKDYVKVSDKKDHDVDGGTFTHNAWQKRDINTEDSDDSGICSIATSQITLAAGTYICSILCPGYKVAQHIARLYNTTDAAQTLLGTSARNGAASEVMSPSCIRGKFTIAAQKVFEVQHYCLTTKNNDGFGGCMSVAGIDSIYTIAEFWRI